MTIGEVSGPLTVRVKSGDIICASGEKNFDLFKIHKGKLLVFVVDGTKVTPLAYLNEGEYLGELSFFDKEPRSANVISLEDTTLIQIPVSEIDKQFPPWLYQMALSITKKIRKSSELIRQKGIRKKNVESIQPLSIDEQREIFLALSQYLEKNSQ